MTRQKWDEGSCTAAYELFVEREGKLPKAMHMNKAHDLPDAATFSRYVGMSPLQYGRERYPDLFAERNDGIADEGGKRTICIRLTTDEELALFKRMNIYLAATGLSKQAYLERLIDCDLHGWPSAGTSGVPMEQNVACIDQPCESQDMATDPHTGLLGAPNQGGEPSCNKCIQRIP